MEPAINSTLTLHHQMTKDISLAAGGFMLLICSLGIGTNCILLITFHRRSQLLNKQMELIVYICVIHLLMALLAFPFIIVSCIANEWVFGDIGCQFYGFFMTVTAFASMSLMTAIAVQRFLVIVGIQHGSEAVKSYVNRRIAVICVIEGLALAILPFVGVGSYGMEQGFMSCTPKWWSRENYDFEYTLLILIFAFFIPFTVICACYIGMFIKVKLKRSSMTTPQGKYQLRLAVIAFFLILSFFFSWGPYAIVAMFQAFDEEFQLSPLLSVIPVIIAKSCVIWNPIIYAMGFKKFRDALKEELCQARTALRLRRREKSGLTQTYV